MGWCFRSEARGVSGGWLERGGGLGGLSVVPSGKRTGPSVLRVNKSAVALKGKRVGQE
jgi:hypothetical protein